MPFPGWTDSSKASRFPRTSKPLLLDVPGHQGPFLNAAVVGDTVLPARALLTHYCAIEADRGRERPFAGAARTLDLDLILFADQIIDEVGLVVPHPRFRSRQFVLEPLAEIAPKTIDPVTGKTVRELLNSPDRSRAGWWVMLGGEAVNRSGLSKVL